MRRDHMNHVYLDGYRVGSSPHVRGALVLSALKAGQRGIIPACAGST